MRPDIDIDHDTYRVVCSSWERHPDGRTAKSAETNKNTNFFLMTTTNDKIRALVDLIVHLIRLQQQVGSKQLEGVCTANVHHHEYNKKKYSIFKCCQNGSDSYIIPLLRPALKRNSSQNRSKSPFTKVFAPLARIFIRLKRTIERLSLYRKNAPIDVLDYFP